MDTNDLNKLKNALQQIEAGEEIPVVKANMEYVNYNQRLIDKINVLKNISILNTDIIKYLYSIKLTDKVADVEPKVNAIYQLVLSANLIEDKALEKEEEKHKEEHFAITSTDEKVIAANIIKTLIGIKEKE